MQGEVPRMLVRKRLQQDQTAVDLEKKVATWLDGLNLPNLENQGREMCQDMNVRVSTSGKLCKAISVTDGCVQ